jgi:NADPH-dependent ferric siderophore reductase
MRTYTARRFDAAAGWVDIDMVLHGDSGPGSRWAGRAAVGDQRHLVRERRFPKERIRFVGYWRRGYTEDEAE